MGRPDLDKVKRPAEEIEKATEDWEGEHGGTTGGNQEEAQPPTPSPRTNR